MQIPRRIIIENFDSMTMHIIIIQVVFLLLSNWFTAAEFEDGDPAFYSHLKEIIDRSSRNNPIEHVDDDAMFLSRSLKQLTLSIKVNLDNVRSLIDRYNYQKEISDAVLFVETLIDRIWTTFSCALEHPNRVSTNTINDMTSALDIIHSNLTTYQPMLKNDLLTWIGQLSDNHPYAFCEKKTSDRITMYTIMRNLMRLEMVVFVATKLYHRRYIYLLDNSTAGVENHSLAKLEKLDLYLKIKENVKKDRPSVIYSCDVENYIRDENYIEIEGLVQPIFITNHLKSYEAANMKANITSCIDLMIIAVWKESFFGNLAQLICDNKVVDILVSGRNEKPCYGYLSHCAPLKSREVCKNNIYVKPNILKRYSWYKIDGQVFGDEDSCPNGFKEKFTSSNDEQIHHCHCTCHENTSESPTTHVLSLAWTLSDIEDNKVITGIKFTRIDRVIHLQIKQGLLIREGRILPGSENWKTVPDVESFGLNNKRDDAWRNFNFIVLDENTIFDLDDVIAGNLQWAVTGVKFYQLEHGRMKLMVRHTRYDWKTGVLNQNLNDRDISPYPNPHELPVSLINPALHQPQVPNVPDSTSDLHYVKLKESSRKTDAGSTTLPFFDAQKVEMEPSFPLSGIGLYHRGSSESAGLISLRLITPDSSTAIAEDYKKSQIIE